MFGWGDYDSDDSDGPQQCQGYAATRGRRCRVMVEAGCGDYCRQHSGSATSWEQHYKTCFVCQTKYPMDFLEGYDDKCCDNDQCWLCYRCEGALQISCPCGCPRCEVYGGELEACKECGSQVCTDCPNLCVDCGKCRYCQSYEMKSEVARNHFAKKKERCYDCFQKTQKKRKRENEVQNQENHDEEKIKPSSIDEPIRKKQKIN
jgi:hypothetical protein